MVFAPLLQPNIQYDPLKDFTQVSMVVLSPFVLVAHPSIGVSTVAQRDNALKNDGRPWLMLAGTPGAHIMIPINK